jgi:hypothetical protein
MNQYIWWRSPKQLIISSTIRDKVINLHIKFGYLVPVTIFDEATIFCQSQLKARSWKGFLRSKAFADFINLKANRRKQKGKEMLPKRWTIPNDFLHINIEKKEERECCCMQNK